MFSRPNKWNDKCTAANHLARYFMAIEQTVDQMKKVATPKQFKHSKRGREDTELREGKASSSSPIDLFQRIRTNNFPTTQSQSERKKRKPPRTKHRRIQTKLESLAKTSSEWRGNRAAQIWRQHRGRRVRSYLDEIDDEAGDEEEDAQGDDDSCGWNRHGTNTPRLASVDDGFRDGDRERIRREKVDFTEQERGSGERSGAAEVGLVMSDEGGAIHQIIDGRRNRRGERPPRDGL